MIKHTLTDPQFENIRNEWQHFLEAHSQIENDYEIFYQDYPMIKDSLGNRFQINFNQDFNYRKTKSSIAKEPLGRSLGAGKLGLRVLDLTAGMGVDTVFLQQLGFNVTAVERNPLIYLALKNAHEKWDSENKSDLQFVFGDAKAYLSEISADQFDVAYYDPMFPDKKKSALPKQEMVLFKGLVGADKDIAEVIQLYVESKKVKRLVVKRPLKEAAVEIGKIKAAGNIQGKIIRYDIY